MSDECTSCGAELLGSDYTTDPDGAYCTNCVPHPHTPADGVRTYRMEATR